MFVCVEQGVGGGCIVAVCTGEAECWCVYSPNTPAVSAERDVGSLPGIRSTGMTHTHTHTGDLFEYGLREIN